jgi:hypothetical protein
VAEMTALGLPLCTEGNEAEYDIVQPLTALVVVKGIDSRGKVVHWTIKTEDLSNVEAMGMALFALDVARGSHGRDED